MGMVSITLLTLESLDGEGFYYSFHFWRPRRGGLLLLFSLLKASMGRVSITLFTFEGLDGEVSLTFSTF